MGLGASNMLQAHDIAEIHKETGFTRSQIVRLYDRFNHLDHDKTGVLSKSDFMRIPELAVNPLASIIIQAIMGNEEEVNFREFVKVLATFRPISNSKVSKPMDTNSRRHKLLFAFRLYDINHDGYICKDDLLEILHMMVGENITTEQLISIAEKCIEEADVDNNTKISFEAFQAALVKVEVETKMSVRFLS